MYSFRNIKFSFYITAFSICVFAQSKTGFTDLAGNNAGQTVFNFLTLPVSANQLSRGMTAVSSNMDATDIPFAASATAFFSKYHFAITHLEWVMGLRKEYLGACFPLLDQGTLGVYSQVFTLGSFDFARDIDENISNPGAAEMAFGVSYAREIIHKIVSAGLSASYIESRLDGEDARALNCAVDAMYKPVYWFTGHIYGRNIGTKVKYNYIKESQPVQLGLSMQFTPFALKDTLASRKFALSFAIGSQKTIDAPLKIAGAMDIRLVRQFGIRAGYEYDYGYTPSLRGLSGGFGLQVKNYGIDAGWKYQSSDFGSVWAVTIKYVTQDMIPKTADDYYKVAMRFFKKKKYKSSIAYAKKALRFNPSMWRAHSLINNCISEIRQEIGTEIVLIYSGNTQGNFIPIIDKGISTGGLARQAAVIKKIRSEYPIHITIDAGNMINKSTPPAKARFADIYYTMMNYDAIGLGSGEIDFDFVKYSKIVKKTSLKHVCTNCNKKVGKSFIDKSIITAGEYKIAILSVVPPNLSMKEEKEQSLKSISLELTRYIQSPNIKTCNLRILIVNDSWQATQFYAKKVSNIDIILNGNMKQHFATPMKSSSIPILSVGKNGKFIGKLVIRFNENKKLISYNNKLIPITKEITPDPQIDILTRKLTLKTDVERHGLTVHTMKGSKTKGVFTFISDRYDIPHIFIRVLSKKTELPLTFGNTTCSSPIISFKNGKILYLAEHDTLPYKTLMSMDIVGSRNQKIGFTGSVSEVCLSPNENWIYAAVTQKNKKHTDIIRIKPDGGETFPVIEWKDGSEQEISFSSTNTNMLFTSNRDGYRHVYITNLSGTSPIRITDTKANHCKPQFDPLDRYIAYMSDRNNFKKKKDIWIYDRNTGKKKRVTRDTKIEGFVWLDDKGTILYWAGVNITDLNTINVFTGKNDKLIITGNIKKYSETNAQVIFYNNRKRIIYVREYPDWSKKLYMVNLDGTNDIQVTFDNGNSWLD